MGLFSLGGAGSFLGRSVRGAAIGGGLGYMNTGDLSGIAGGAGAGALFGGFGIPRAMGIGGRLGGRLAGYGARGVGLGMRGARALAGAGAGMARSSGLRSNLGFGMLRAGNLGQRGMAAAGSFLGGAGGVAVNKYGGMGLAALGLGASAHIGSSLISSNRGF